MQQKKKQKEMLSRMAIWSAYIIAVVQIAILYLFIEAQVLMSSVQLRVVCMMRTLLTFVYHVSSLAMTAYYVLLSLLKTFQFNQPKT